MCYFNTLIIEEPDEQPVTTDKIRRKSACHRMQEKLCNNHVVFLLSIDLTKRCNNDVVLTLTTNSRYVLYLEKGCRKIEMCTR